MTSLLGGVCVLQDASIIGGFPESVEGNLHFAMSSQRLVGHADGFPVHGASPIWPSHIVERARRIGDVVNGKLNTAAQADREQGNRRHSRFLTVTQERDIPTARGFLQGLVLTGLDHIAQGEPARLGRGLVGHPPKVGAASHRSTPDQRKASV